MDVVECVYTREWDHIDNPGRSIFLAGPTSRKGCTLLSWRVEALAILQKLGFEGKVFIPECRSGEWEDEKLTDAAYDDQVAWEERHLEVVSVRLFWVPRSVEWPAYTTNVEFGEFYDGRFGDCVYGRPDGAPKTRYLDAKWWRKHHTPPFDNLLDLCDAAILMCLPTQCQ